MLVDKTKDFSFPSDHATVVGAVAIGLLLVRRPLGIIAIVLAVGMACARVYVGAHYPGDVAAGLIIGGITALGVCTVTAKIGTPMLQRLSSTPLRPLLVSTERD